MPGSMTFSTLEGMEYYLPNHLVGKRVNIRFQTAPGRVEIERPGKADSVASLMIEVPEEVGLGESQRKLESLARSLGCGGGLSQVKSESFDYDPPKRLEQPVLLEDLGHYHRQVRDYGDEARRYRRLTAEISGQGAAELVNHIKNHAKEVRYLERTTGSDDIFALYYPEDGSSGMVDDKVRGQGDHHQPTAYLKKASRLIAQGLDPHFEEIEQALSRLATQPVTEEVLRTAVELTAGALERVKRPMALGASRREATRLLEEPGRPQVDWCAPLSYAAVDPVLAAAFEALAQQGLEFLRQRTELDPGLFRRHPDQVRWKAGQVELVSPPSLTVQTLLEGARPIKLFASHKLEKRDLPVRPEVEALKFLSSGELRSLTEELVERADPDGDLRELYVLNEILARPELAERLDPMKSQLGSLPAELVGRGSRLDHADGVELLVGLVDRLAGDNPDAVAEVAVIPAFGPWLGALVREHPESQGPVVERLLEQKALSLEQVQCLALGLANDLPLGAETVVSLFEEFCPADIPFQESMPAPFPESESLARWAKQILTKAASGWLKRQGFRDQATPEGERLYGQLVKELGQTTGHFETHFGHSWEDLIDLLGNPTEGLDVQAWGLEQRVRFAHLAGHCLSRPQWRDFVDQVMEDPQGRVTPEEVEFFRRQADFADRIRTELTQQPDDLLDWATSRQTIEQAVKESRLPGAVIQEVDQKLQDEKDERRNQPALDFILDAFQGGEAWSQVRNFAPHLEEVGDELQVLKGSDHLARRLGHVKTLLPVLQSASEESRAQVLKLVKTADLNRLPSRELAQVALEQPRALPALATFMATFPPGEAGERAQAFGEHLSTFAEEIGGLGGGWSARQRLDHLAECLPSLERAQLEPEARGIFFELMKEQPPKDLPGTGFIELAGDHPEVLEQVAKLAAHEGSLKMVVSEVCQLAALAPEELEGHLATAVKLGSIRGLSEVRRLASDHKPELELVLEDPDTLRIDTHFLDIED